MMQTPGWYTGVAPVSSYTDFFGEAFVAVVPETNFHEYTLTNLANGKAEKLTFKEARKLLDEKFEGPPLPNKHNPERVYVSGDERFLMEFALNEEALKAQKAKQDEQLATLRQQFEKDLVATHLQGFEHLHKMVYQRTQEIVREYGKGYGDIMEIYDTMAELAIEVAQLK